jgi:hypothetical protein
MTDQQYGDYQFEVHVDGLEGRTLNYPVDFATLERAAAEVPPTRVHSHRRAQARYRGVAVTLDTWILGWRPSDLNSGSVPELKPYRPQNFSPMTPHCRGSLGHRKPTRGRPSWNGATDVGDPASVR